MEDIEGGHGYGKKKPRFSGRLQLHIDATMASAGAILLLTNQLVKKGRSYSIGL
jgi:hypothetical protein